MTWLFVRISPSEVRTMPVPAAAPPWYPRTVRMLTTPVPIVAALDRLASARLTATAPAAAMTPRRAMVRDERCLSIFFIADIEPCVAERQLRNAGILRGPLGSGRGVSRDSRGGRRVGGASEPGGQDPPRRGHHRGRRADAVARTHLALPAADARAQTPRARAGRDLRRPRRNADAAPRRPAGARRRRARRRRHRRDRNRVADAQRDGRRGRRLRLRCPARRGTGGAPRRRRPLTTPPPPPRASG